ncbi:MAG: Sir2 silent information regulator family NAD-dependent deacetylase [Bacteroidaceae bacterium]|nr:Sir2 silent information regulator family NAD-dependent deacetylase [Bacteroidaceae bacterium]
MTSTDDYSRRIEQLHKLIAEADNIIIGAGAGLSTAAGLQYAGPEFMHYFRPWVERYGISDLYSSSFYPFKTEEELWACWAMHIWYARYRPDAMPLYQQLLDVVKGKNYFVITTNVDGQFEKAGFDKNRLFATQGDYALFQPKSGYPKETWNNREWVELVLPLIRDCHIPTEMIPRVPDTYAPVSMNLRCDDTFVEDIHWHEQCERYQEFVSESSDKQLLLLEFGVGFNTPVIIRFPFERMAKEWKRTTLIRFNPNESQPFLKDLSRYIVFQEDIQKVLSAAP